MSSRRNRSFDDSTDGRKRAAPVGIAVRPARSADAPSLASLLSELGYATSTGAMDQRLEVLLNHADYRTLVADEAGAVLGMVGLARGWFYERDGAYVRVVALVVTASRRGGGIGTALLAAAEAWASESGAVVMMLTSGKRRSDAHRFYQRMGFENTGYRFVKPVGTGEGL